MSPTTGVYPGMVPAENAWSWKVLADNRVIILPPVIADNGKKKLAFKV